VGNGSWAAVVLCAAVASGCWQSSLTPAAVSSMDDPRLAAEDVAVYQSVFTL
jgi:hypothetical protein